MAVTGYVQDCVACASIFGFLRSSNVTLVTEVVLQLFSFLSADAIWSFVNFVTVLSYSCILLDKYHVRQGDVVKLGSVTDDLFCLCNSVVSIQPHNRLRQQPEGFKQNIFSNWSVLGTNRTETVLMYLEFSSSLRFNKPIGRRFSNWLRSVAWELCNFGKMEGRMALKVMF